MKRGWPFRAQDWGLDWVIPKVVRMCIHLDGYFAPPPLDPYPQLRELMRREMLSNQQLAHKVLRRSGELARDGERGNGDAA